MPAWFDMRGLNPQAKEDHEGIQKAAAGVHNLISEEVNGGIPSQRVLLGGFSQGGALALYSSFTTGHRLAGVVALSCWLPLPDNFPSVVVGNTETPVMMCHGDEDERISYSWGQQSSELVKQFNKSLDFRTYRNLGHSSSDQEMDEVKAFIERCLPPVIQ